MVTVLLTYVTYSNSVKLTTISKLDVPRYNTTKYDKHSFKYFGSQLWNNLPVSLKSSPDINDFKKLIKTWACPSCKCNYCKH